MFKKALKLILTFLILSLLAPPLFSQEDSDRGLSEAQLLSLREIDSLIKETKYDEALKELNLYIENNPESFDVAQLRIQKIMNLREDYASIYDKVHEILLNDPENDEKLEFYTGQLRKIEKQKDTPLGLFIDEIYVTARFRINLAKMNRINEESSQLIQENKYEEALAVISSGFDLYLDAFEEDWLESEHTKDIFNPAMSAKTHLTNLTESFSEYSTRLSSAVNKYISAINAEDLTMVNRAFAEVKNEFTEYSALRSSIYGTAIEFNRIFNLCKEVARKNGEDELTDASFLPFIQRFVTGKSDNRYTGVMGVLNTQWENSMKLMTGVLKEKMDAKMLALQKELPQRIFDKDYNPEKALWMTSDLKDWNRISMNTSNLNSLLNPEIQEILDKTEKWNQYIAYETLLSDYTEGLFNLKAQISNNSHIEVSRPENPAQSELASSDYVNKLLSILDSGDLTDSQRKLMVFNFSENITDWREIEAKLKNYVNQINDYMENRTINTYKEIFAYWEAADSSYLKDAETRHSTIEKTLLGSERHDEDGNITFTEFYPYKVQALCSSLETDLKKEIAVIDKQIKQVQAFANNLIQHSTYNKILEAREKLAAYLDSSIAKKTESEEQIRLSERYKKEAENRYTQAERALKQKNFDTARTRLSDAQTNYLRSLEINFDLALQTESDAKLAALGARIAQGENIIVVEEVRNLKKTAWEQYYSQNFEQASKLLSEAAERWQSTNIENDEEIEYLTRIINTALSMKTGRTLHPSDALYPEMSQLLSGAGKDYEDGIKLGPNTEKGKAKLQEAKNKLEKVLLVYSYNEEARELNMKIDQKIDPVKFEREFAAQVAEIQKAYNSKTTTQETYAKLLDLYELNPKYKGLAALKDNIEYQIGIKRKPVDKTEQKEADNLVKQAQDLIAKAGRDEELLKKALIPLDKALEKNPNDVQAMKLKDEIQLRVGGKAAVVLSAEDENLFQMATTDYLNGNYRSAKSKVDSLLKKKTNQNSAKILKLQKQIEAQLS